MITHGRVTIKEDDPAYLALSVPKGILHVGAVYLSKVSIPILYCWYDQTTKEFLSDYVEGNPSLNRPYMPFLTASRYPLSSPRWNKDYQKSMAEWLARYYLLFNIRRFVV